MTPEMVGATRELVMGKHTGTHSVRQRLTDAGFDPTESQVRAVTRRVKDAGAEGRVTMSDVRRFAGEEGVARMDEDLEEEEREQEARV